MDETDILKKAGLSEAQADVYSCLLTNGAMTPTELAERTEQSRENCYAVAKRLVELGLIEQVGDKKAKYKVLNPSALETLVEKRRRIMAKNEKFVKDNLSSLLDIFYANNEMPGARTIEGIDGVREVYEDNLRVRKDLYFIHTKNPDSLGKDKDPDSFMRKYRDQRPLLGIHTYALTPATEKRLKRFSKIRDEATNFHRTWMPESDYTAPVEIQAYGDKVAIISFGETQMATIIISPVIAEAMRQILKSMMNFYQKNYKQDFKSGQRES